MKQIHLRTVADITNLITRLDNLLDGLSSGQIPERIAEEGASAAEQAYGFPVSVVKTSDDSANIIASHEGLSFLEFGAGLTTNEGHPDAPEVPYPVYRGSYSDHNGGMYQQTGYQYWVFGGQVYDRVVPRGGMLAAGMAIRDNMEEIVKEVTGL